MNNWWVSWYHEEKFSDFELESPWWLTGYRCADDAATICAAIKANSQEEATKQVYSAYDEMPKIIEFRFVEVRDDAWSPFNSRFEKGEWMIWEDTNEQAD